MEPHRKIIWTNKGAIYRPEQSTFEFTRDQDVDRGFNYCYFCGQKAQLSCTEHNILDKLKSLPPKPRHRPASAYYVAPPLPHNDEKKRASSASRVEFKKEEVYKVTIRTGDDKDAGTSSKIYITIRGTKETLERQLLGAKTPNARFAFVRSSTNSFHIRSVYLGDLKGVVIENDGHEESDGWLLDSLSIRHLRTGYKWRFQGGKWLSKFKHKGHCFAELRPTGVSKKGHSSKHRSSSRHSDHSHHNDHKDHSDHHKKREYLIHIETGDRMMAGTDANVHITLFGDEHDTGKVRLQTEKKDMERGSKDQYIIKTPNVGPIRKIRVEHDSAGACPSWYVETIRIENMHNKKENYRFECGQWLSKKYGTSKEFFPDRPYDEPHSSHRAITSEKLEKHDKKEPKKHETAKSRKKVGEETDDEDDKENEEEGIVRYTLLVATGDKPNASTNARVYIQLFGEHGLTTKHELLNETENMFEAGMIDEFEFKDQYVGKLKGIKVWHDNTGLGPEWYLKWIRIYQPQLKGFVPRPHSAKHEKHVDHGQQSSRSHSMDNKNGKSTLRTTTSTDKKRSLSRSSKKSDSDSDHDALKRRQQTPRSKSPFDKTKKRIDDSDDDEDLLKKKKSPTMARKDGKVGRKSPERPSSSMKDHKKVDPKKKGVVAGKKDDSDGEMDDFQKRIAAIKKKMADAEKPKTTATATKTAAGKHTDRVAGDKHAGMTKGKNKLLEDSDDDDDDDDDHNHRRHKEVKVRVVKRTARRRRRADSHRDDEESDTPPELNEKHSSVHHDRQKEVRILVNEHVDSSDSDASHASSDDSDEDLWWKDYADFLQDHEKFQGYLFSCKEWLDSDRPSRVLRPTKQRQILIRSDERVSVASPQSRRSKKRDVSSSSEDDSDDDDDDDDDDNSH